MAIKSVTLNVRCVSACFSVEKAFMCDDVGQTRTYRNSALKQIRNEKHKIQNFAVLAF